MKPLLIIVLTVLVLIILWMLYNCKLRCGTSAKDGYYNPYELLDNSYGKRSLPSYTQKWDYNVPHDTGHAFINGRAMSSKGWSTEDNISSEGFTLSKREGMMSLGAGFQDIVGDGEYADKSQFVEPLESFTRGSPVVGECKPFHIYNDYTGRCDPLFEDLPSAKRVERTAAIRRPHDPMVTIPGTTLFGYGVDRETPNDVPLKNLGVQW